MASTMRPPRPGADMDSMYSSEGGGDGGGGGAPDKGPDQPDTIDQERQEQQDDAGTALVDNKVLSPDGKPLKPGDEIVLKIVAVHGDESEVAYAPKDEKEKGSGMMEDSDAELDGMDKPNM